jgi:hypothetical protein
MVRTRIPEASLVGLLAALATFCALEARGGQPYSIVGQSSPATAATGRRPIAERIKAANRPIRIAAEEELAPDQGLIPSLNDPTTVEREWTPNPAVVEFPTGGPDAIAIDETLPTLEPGVMPPPDSTAIAAHPTTGDDAGLVGEASTIETDASATTADGDESTGDSTEASPTTTEGSAAPPDRLSASATARGQAARAPSPRRTSARVTPQRREALLDRLRAALADVPRPLGLIPASPRQKASSRQATAPRTAIARQPVPAASLPVPLTALPATTTPTDETLPSDSLAETPLTEELPSDGSETGSETADASALADHGSTTAPTAAEDAPATLEADSALTTADATDQLVDADAPGTGADATEACPASPVAEPEASTEVAASAAPVAAVDSATPTIASSATPAADLATPPAADLTATPAPQQARTTPNAQSRRHGGSQRTGASHAPQQPMTPLDRLQARLEQMPRALGLVPAPRPSMHANRAPQRRAAPPAPAAASLSSAAAESTSATTAPAEPALADRDTVANDEAGEAPQAPSTTEGDVAVASQAEATIGDEGSAEPTVPTPDKPTLVTDVEIDQDHLAVVDGEGEATIGSPASDAESIEEEVDAVSAAASPDEPVLVATTVEESVMPAPVAESMPAAGLPSAAVAKRPATRQPARQPAAPIVRRPIRDALGSALANMPRPFGLLPEPEAAPRRSAASQAKGPTAPRALATKSIGTRPLDAGSKVQPGNALAIVAAPPALPQSADDGATLTSGNDAEDHAEHAEMPAAIADSATEPAPLDVDLPEGASEAEAPQASPASVEVTVECPEETTTLGERVTLQLTIRNTGTAPVSSVTPVVHFGAGLEPLGIRGRNGHFSADGSVMFDRLAELPAGACVELEVVAVCTGTGTIPYRGAAWCGDGEDREIVPADDSVTVTPSALAAEPATVRQR